MVGMERRQLSWQRGVQVSQWKRQLLDGASELFSRGKNTKDKEEGQAKEAELFQQFGRLQMELEWLKKSLSCSDARELRKLVDHDHPELSVSRQCALLRSDPRSITGPRRSGHRPCGSWRGSTLSTWMIPAAAAAEWWTTWPETGSRSGATGCEPGWWATAGQDRGMLSARLDRQ